MALRRNKIQSDRLADAQDDISAVLTGFEANLATLDFASGELDAVNAEETARIAAAEARRATADATKARGANLRTNLTALLHGSVDNADIA
jgi:uncharacterized protein involved in exopolysaccharide biosynthesis